MTLKNLVEGVESKLGEAVETIAGSTEDAVEKVAEVLPPEDLADKLGEEVTLLTANASGFGEGLLDQAAETEGIPVNELDSVTDALSIEDENLAGAKEEFENTLDSLVGREAEENNELDPEILTGELDPQLPEQIPSLQTEEFKNVMEEFAPGELNTAKEISTEMFARANNLFVEQGLDFNEFGEQLGSEDDSNSELLLLMLRIGIKVSAKVAATTARNIARDRDTSKGMRIMMGTFADLTDETSGFADKAIAKDSQANLTDDIISYFNK